MVLSKNSGAGSNYQDALDCLRLQVQRAVKAMVGKHPVFQCFGKVIYYIYINVCVYIYIHVCFDISWVFAEKYASNFKGSDFFFGLRQLTQLPEKINHG